MGFMCDSLLSIFNNISEGVSIGMGENAICNRLKD